MRKTLSTTFLVLFLAPVLAAPPARAGDNTVLGTMIGAGVGGLLGSKIGKGEGQLVATGAGVFLGGLMGNSIGNSLDRGNAAYYGGGSYSTPAYNTYSTYEPYQSRTNYVAPYDYYDYGGDVNDVVYVRPGAVEYYSPSQTVLVEGGYVQATGYGPAYRRHEGGRRHGRGQHCREFTQTVRIDGRSHESYGTACLRPDGSWQIEQ